MQMFKIFKNKHECTHITDKNNVGGIFLITLVGFFFLLAIHL